MHFRKHSSWVPEGEEQKVKKKIKIPSFYVFFFSVLKEAKKIFFFLGAQVVLFYFRLYVQRHFFDVLWYAEWSF
jgi:hypothetical protein